MGRDYGCEVWATGWRRLEGCLSGGEEGDDCLSHILSKCRASTIVGKKPEWTNEKSRRMNAGGRRELCRMGRILEYKCKEEGEEKGQEKEEERREDQNPPGKREKRYQGKSDQSFIFIINYRFFCLKSRSRFIHQKGKNKSRNQNIKGSAELILTKQGKK